MITGLTGRENIYTDEPVITDENIFGVITQGIFDHAASRNEIIRLFKYELGEQPVLHREKPIRSEINYKVCANYARQIVDFKTGYVYGSPYSYVQRAKNEADKSLPAEDDIRIARLNEMFYEQNKPTVDTEVFRNACICGVGYMMVIPKHADDGSLSPFDVLSLDPWNTFIIRSNDAYKRPVVGVTYTENRDGTYSMTAYTKDFIYQTAARREVIQREDHSEETVWRNIGRYNVTPNVIGVIPIVEFEYSKARQGAFEPVIPLMDALNVTNSDRVNDVAQYVQAILWVNDCKLTEDQKNGLINGGMISTKSTADGRNAKIEYISAPLDQTQTQALVDYMYSQILEIAGVPSRENSNSGNGSAVVLGAGWQIAETQAKTSVMLADACEREVANIALAIIRATDKPMPDDVGSLTLSDITPHIGRNKTYELSSRVNSMVSLFKAGIDPETAITVVDIFDDPQQVCIDSIERINSLLGLNADGTVDGTADEVEENEIEEVAEESWDDYGDDMLRGEVKV